MPVPKISQLQPGVSVNIVLKADQRSGKLTAGQVSEILTKGNHPHGIKVRLSNGQVGRVQSLSMMSNQSISTWAPPPTSTARGIQGSLTGHAPPDPAGRGRRKGTSAIQEDYRQDPTPQESRSLADYIKSPASSESAAIFASSARENAVQRQLEIDFPKLDTALIAAIFADNDDQEAARSVLFSLSSS